MFVSALAMFVAVVLGVAGLLKLRAPDALVIPLKSVLPARLLFLAPRRLAILLGVAEVATALFLVAPRMPGRLREVGGYAAFLLCGGFLIFILFARRNAASCGCFGKLSLRPVGRVEVARNGVLLGVAGAVAVAGPRPATTGAAWALAAAFLALFFLASFAGYRSVGASTVQPVGGAELPAQFTPPPPPPDFLREHFTAEAVSRRKALSYAGMTLGGLIASSVMTIAKPGLALAAAPVTKMPAGTDQLLAIPHSAQQTAGLVQGLQANISWASDYLQSHGLTLDWANASSATGVAAISWWSPTLPPPQLKMLVVPLQPRGFLAWSPDLSRSAAGGGLATDGVTQTVWDGSSVRVSAASCDVTACAGEAIGVGVTIIGGVACVVGCIDTLGLGCLVCATVTAGGAASGALGAGACSSCTISSTSQQAACVALNASRPYADNCCMSPGTAPCNVRTNACNCGGYCCGCENCPRSVSGDACISLFNQATGAYCGCGCCCFTGPNEVGP